MDQPGYSLISCVICTYQRPHNLVAAIESLVNQNIDPNRYEIIVVDNNSQDETSEIVQNYQKNSRQKIVYLLEKKQGLSYARNAGIEGAQGSYIAFLDDDAEADPNWLYSLLRVIESDQDIWVVGGRILPKWDGDRPSWLEDYLIDNYSVLDLGNEQKDLSSPDHVLGTNFCFRKDASIEIGNFETSLGRTGNNLLGDEDTEIQQRVYSIGKRVVYVPEAIVWHHISPDRLTKKYIYTRAFGTGRARAIIIARNNQYLTCFYHFLRAITGLSYYGFLFFFTFLNSKRRLRYTRSIYTKLGFIRQLAGYLLFRNREQGLCIPIG